ncbi:MULTISPECIES: hypothetical protein [Azospirillum]|uniref:DUF3829 domain-containing protein n=2 Tax=Azospirillum brasilense TaxID=192 RepID=A0ABU4P577_AZOBR|nr:MULTISPECIES: hypothetical protein [Azospirillum]MDW7557791.1 hypothetical protein [Azospirillum brasilense]MDW7597425.1 hypothetical protein [Azospirillum brasilense]MDW7632688.1 hypothetical protein [Azospirillum brasilense]MDX5952431.1 hypothetical protein [Azospirillum brasilense]TVZ60492.1 hypothetical protein OH82_02327 [Azospirillum brasilense]
MEKHSTKISFRCKFQHRVRAVAATLFVLSGCAGTEQYNQLSQVGAGYAQAMEAALSDYRRTYIDARSEEYLADMALLNLDSRQEGRRSQRGEPTQFGIDSCRQQAPAAGANSTPTDFAARQCADIARVIVISRLITHAQLFGEYFNQLGKLATSDAPQAAGAAAGRVADSLKAVGTALDRAVPGQTAALDPIARAVTEAVQRAELRNELDRNQELIRREMAIEDKTLAYLEKQAESEQLRLFERRFDRLVSVPVRRGEVAQQGDRWVENRRALLLETDQAASTAAARRALKSLRGSYEALVAGGDARALLEQALADTAMVLDAVEPLVGRL